MSKEFIQKFEQLLFSCDEKNIAVAFQLAEGNPVLKEHLKKIDKAYTTLIKPSTLEDDFVYNLQQDRLDYGVSENEPVSWLLAYMKGVSQLGFYDLNDKGIPAEVGQLTQLEELIAGNIQLKGLPKEIGQLKNLKRLRLDYNSLTELPEELGQLQSLEMLDLEYNFFRHIPKAVTQLSNLKYLNIEANPLQSVCAGIGQLSSLVSLSIAGSVHGGDFEPAKIAILPPEIGLLDRLEYLEVSSCSLQQVPKDIGLQAVIKILNILRQNRIIQLI